MNIGETGYFIRRGRNEVEETCPDCAGTLSHHIVLGGGDEHDIPCETCKRGYLGPTGTVKTYQNRAVVKSGRVVSLKVGEAGVQEYTISVYYENQDPLEPGVFSEEPFEPVDVFITPGDANRKADTITAEQVERHRTDKKDQARSWAWHVTYHRRTIRENLKQNVYHEEQLAFARTKANK